MKGRMNMIKEDILNMLKELNFPKDEFYIVGGSSLVMRGIREIAGDLDLCISTELFNNIKEKYELTDEKRNECGFYKINDELEVVVNEKYEFDMEEGELYNLENINTILNFKLKRNAPKDQKDIENIKKYIEGKKS